MHSSHAEAEKKQMTIYAAIWGVLALVLVSLAVYRKVITRDEDNVIHVSGANWNAMSKQETSAHAIAQVDRAGMTLTIVAAIYGLALASYYFYGVWEHGHGLSY